MTLFLGVILKVAIAPSKEVNIKMEELEKEPK